MDAATILVAGTASHVGKSTVATGLCRLLADRGVDVAPFKAQNMSNNAQVVPRVTDDRGGEIGISQFVQARAAGVVPTTDHNPVLLKPTGDGQSQVIVNGRPAGTRSAAGYYDDHWTECLEAAETAHARLAREHEVIVAEGAGSIAEPNLAHRDLANIETARFADARILLLADIERGGAFASLVGTIDLLPANIRQRLAGAVITKFRGDRSLLTDGIETVEDRTGVPILGVLPYDDPGLPAEDSVSLPGPNERGVLGSGALRSDRTRDGDGHGENGRERSIRIGVPRLPHISNATDLEPLARIPRVLVEVHPLADGVDRYDAVVIPGTKNTVDDLLELRRAGYGDRLGRFEGPILGICGGYQLLGRELRNAHREGAGDRQAVPGIGLLPVRTRFERKKRVRRVVRTPTEVGPFGAVAGRVAGYEIHHGVTELQAPLDRPFEDDGAILDNVIGTYLHGLFENDAVRHSFVSLIADRTGVTCPNLTQSNGIDPYAAAAELLTTWCDLAPMLPRRCR